MEEYESWTAFYMCQKKEADEPTREVDCVAGNMNSNVDQLQVGLTLLFVRA